MIAATGNVAVGQEVEARRLVLKVTVEVSADSNDTIFVYEGDQSRDLAIDFCRRHALQDNLVGPLTAHITENLKKVTNNGNVDHASSADGARRNHVGSRDGAVTPGRKPIKAMPQSARENLHSTATPTRGGRSSTGGMGRIHSARTPDRSAGSNPRIVASPSIAPERPAPARAPVAATQQPLSARGGVARGAPPFGAGSGGGSRPSTPDRQSNRSGRIARTPGAEAQTQNLTAGDSTGSAAMPLSYHDSADGARPDSADRFKSLHQDATQRRSRMDRLRTQVERDIEHQHSRAPCAPGSARYQPNRDSERRSSSLGERLYQDAGERRARLREVQNKAAQQRLEEELSGATFSPAIGASQRSWHGVGRSSIDPQGVKTKQKIESMRQIKEKSALDGCTFHPEIDTKSEQLMSQRINRLKITGNLYDHLYEDAQRRQERQVEYNRSLPRGVTFTPDIGCDHNRPPNDDNKEDFVNRLAYSKSMSEKWLSMRRQQLQCDSELSKESRSQPEFHPQTGRAPTSSRNKDGLPIGEFLYESGREKAEAKEEARQERSQASAPKVGEASKQLFEESKQRKYKDLYEVLSGGDPERQLCFASLSLGGLDEELTDFLRPMLAYLKETEAALDFESFCVALDYQRQHSATPTAHLFVQKSRTRTSDRYRQEADGEAFTPRTDPNSNKIASRHRPRGATPLHEQLLREKEVWDSKLHEQRVILEERKLQECSFQPNAIRRASSSERVGSFLGQSPRRHSGDGELQASSSDPLLAGRAIRLGGIMLPDPTTTAATGSVTESGNATPRENGNHRRAGNPVAQIINSLQSSRDRAFVEGILQSYGGDALPLDSCRVQIDEAELAVAQCKTLLAASTQPFVREGGAASA